jgi:hypothetical protein
MVAEQASFLAPALPEAFLARWRQLEEARGPSGLVLAPLPTFHVDHRGRMWGAISVGVVTVHLFGRTARDAAERIFREVFQR